MKYDFLEPSTEFQTSVNIAFDLNNKNKVKSFIPTSSAVSLFEDILLSTDDLSTDRARILIGAYGKGKSHIVLAILSILYHKDSDAAQPFLAKVKATDPNLYQYAINYIASSKRLLPVIISGNSSSLTQSFLRALYNTLKLINMPQLMPETNYEMALRMVHLWKSDYPDVYQKLQDLLPMPVASFINLLGDYDTAAYSLFETIYPQLTAGNEFNPFAGYDVVELYDTVCQKLESIGYSGMYVVYDEFSKYLESSITKASVDDIKMLQDFAEKCNRSEKKQLHLLLISHKEIENYIDILPKQKVDGWRGVSERFSHVNMKTDYPQTYEVLSSAVRKVPDQWAAYKNVHKRDFDGLLERFRNVQLFADCTEEQYQDAVVECFPLHPISTFMLPRISEKVAQNERTLFTFVAGRDALCLANINMPSGSDLPLVTPDKLYDYFAPQMRKEAYTSEIHKLYSLTSEILTKIDGDSLSAKIIKTISLIYCIGQFNTLAPTVEVINDVFCNADVTTEEIRTTIEDLIKKQLVVYLKRSNAYLQLKRSSGVDIFAEISNTIEKRKDIVSPADILNNANVEPYLYPIRYNDVRSMTRYFDFRFVSALDIEKGRVPESSADGYILGVVPESTESSLANAKETAERFQECQRTILVFPVTSSNIVKELRMYDAVNLLRASAEDDEALRNEYDVVFQDLQEVINGYVAQYIHPELHGADYWFQAMRQKIYRKSHLTELLSQICDRVFPYTPVINNEVINRNKLTTMALNSRTKVVSALMQGNLLPNLGLSGTGQEVSFMRSTLILTGVLQQNPLGGCSINEDTKDANLTNVFSVINAFLNQTKQFGKKSFSDLYQTLIGVENGIGMRKGLIPIYIAAAFRKFEGHIIIWDEKGEVKLTATLLNQINECPEKYIIQIEEWTDLKEQFIASLENLYSDFVIEKEKQFGMYAYLVQAMSRWYLSLPKYVKDTKSVFSHGEYERIDKKKKDFLSLLKQANIGAQELLFTRLPRIYGYDSVCSELLAEIQEAKQFFSTVKASLERELIQETCKILGGDQDVGIAAAAIAWTERLSDHAKNKLYANGAERVIAVLEKPGNDEIALVGALAKALVGLRIEDWNERSPDIFFDNLIKYKATVEEENRNGEAVDQVHEASAAGSQYSVTFVDDQGNAKQRTFERTVYSKRAKLLYNVLSTNLAEMGHAVSPEEKRQVLMEILETLC